MQAFRLIEKQRKEDREEVWKKKRVNIQSLLSQVDQD